MTDMLTEAARSARERAYAPYSGFQVGAAVETESGEVFSGSNVENASYGLTICAERVAVAAAVAAGHRRMRRLVVVAGSREAVAPCGACLQVLVEFGPDMEVIGVGATGPVRWTMAELLPAPFNRAMMGGQDEIDER